MFSVEKNNAKVGKYLAELIDGQYKSRRAFCRDYLDACGEDINEESVGRMSNRVSQMIKGEKAIQTYDLPIFTKLLGVSCEQIVSAGECAVPVLNRVTNYSIACSKDKEEWKRYIERDDKLILNSDEYCKTVLDYAIEFRNYDFVKFLMDHKYIWFDSRDENDYFQTFGAGTSIKRRDVSHVDWGLEGRIKYEDDLRVDMIALAADNEDFEMLNRLRAREIPQLYHRVHYIAGENPDFSVGFSERTVNHIACSNEMILDYFTDPFEISDDTRYKDGSKRKHTFQYPYISELLDQLIIEKADFTETALKKCLKYNEGVYKKLKELVKLIKNDEFYSEAYDKDMWKKACMDGFRFYDDGNIVMFYVYLSSKKIDGLVTNIAHVKKMPKTPILKHWAEDLNESYDKTITFTEHLEEI